MANVIKLEPCPLRLIDIYWEGPNTHTGARVLAVMDVFVIVFGISDLGPCWNYPPTKFVCERERERERGERKRERIILSDVCVRSSTCMSVGKRLVVMPTKT